MTPGFLRAIFATLTAASALPAQAEYTISDLQRCRQIAEPLVRVACYDAVHLPAPAPLGPGDAVTQLGASAAVAPPQATADRPAATVTPTFPATVSAIAVPAVAANADSSFGLPVRPAAAAQDALESTIYGPFDGWVADTSFTLANGQVWQINDGSTTAYVAQQNARVRVTRGLLGSYFMQVEGVSQMPRVKRLK